MTQLLPSIGAVALLMTIVAAVGLVRRDNSIVDVFWGPAFVAITAGALLAAPVVHWRAALVAALVMVWAGRLALHIGLRRRGHTGEDFRYAAWRAQWGRSWVARSILQVYTLQGALALLVAAPILVVTTSTAPAGAIDVWAVIGSALWALGLTIETVADLQIMRFQARKKAGHEQAKMCMTGLWSYSRHPNYLGEVVLWWGIGVVALGEPSGWIGLIGPVVITALIRFVSGVPMLERAWKQREGFAEWAATTPVFLPLIPRRRPG